jgi:MucR family transcriptional regulator, transcriptional regulator of exopolysaccharide biosynthesis
VKEYYCRCNFRTIDSIFAGNDAVERRLEAGSLSASAVLAGSEREAEDQPTAGKLEPMSETNYIELTAEIVSAYVSNNPVPAADMPALINQVHSALTRVSGGQADVVPEPLKPAVSVKKSITPDYIVCLEDGKKFKSLKRHLRTQYNMTPEQYRDKWGLPPDYPMVAPNYAAARSQLAKQMGLGQQRRRRGR